MGRMSYQYLCLGRQLSPCVMIGSSAHHHGALSFHSSSWGMYYYLHFVDN